MLSQRRHQHERCLCAAELLKSDLAARCAHELNARGVHQVDPATTHRDINRDAGATGSAIPASGPAALFACFERARTRHITHGANRLVGGEMKCIALSNAVATSGSS